MYSRQTRTAAPLPCQLRVDRRIDLMKPPNSAPISRRHSIVLDRIDRDAIETEETHRARSADLFLESARKFLNTRLLPPFTRASQSRASSLRIRGLGSLERSSFERTRSCRVALEEVLIDLTRAIGEARRTYRRHRDGIRASSAGGAAEGQRPRRLKLPVIFPSAVVGRLDMKTGRLLDSIAACVDAAPVLRTAELVRLEHRFTSPVSASAQRPSAHVGTDAGLVSSKRFLGYGSYGIDSSSSGR